MERSDAEFTSVDVDKVLLGIQYHLDGKFMESCDGCPYDSNDSSCVWRLLRDAGYLLQQMKRENTKEDGLHA